MKGCEWFKLFRSPVKNRPQRSIVVFYSPLILVTINGDKDHRFLFFPWQLQHALCCQFANAHPFIAIHPEVYAQWDSGVSIFIA